MIATETLKLNLGSRTRLMPGFKNMDIDAHDGVDFVGDVSDLSRFADGSVSEIYASHILEHFPHLKTLDVLKEWSRVLSPGGKLYVAVPDFARCVELYGTLGLDQWIVNFLSGDQIYATAYHYNLFDEPRLTKYLADSGFSDSFRVEAFPIGDENDCSNLASTIDGERVSLNMVAIR
jgi:predicted SAM-dependent methyltransferase